MTVLVIDASVLAVALGDDSETGDLARQRIAGHHLWAPDLIYLEVASVLRRQVAAGAMDDRRAGLGLTDLMDLPMDIAPHRQLLPRCWQLRENVTVYDGAYVALAEALDATLLTADARLTRAVGPHCVIELFP